MILILIFDHYYFQFCVINCTCRIHDRFLSLNPYFFKINYLFLFLALNLISSRFIGLFLDVIIAFANKILLDLYYFYVQYFSIVNFLVSLINCIYISNIYIAFTFVSIFFIFILHFDFWFDIIKNYHNFNFLIPKIEISYLFDLKYYLVFHSFY